MSFKVPPLSKVNRFRVSLNLGSSNELNHSVRNKVSLKMFPSI